MGASSRERLKKTLSHENPGKVVVDLGSASTTGIHTMALANLRKALGLEEIREKAYEPFQLLGEVDEDIRKAVGVDVVGVGTNTTIYGYNNDNWKDWTLPQGTPVRVGGGFEVTGDECGNTLIYPQGDRTALPCAKLPKGGFFFDNIERNFAPYDEDLADATQARIDFKNDFSVWNEQQLRYMEKEIDYYYGETEYGIFGSAALTFLADMAYTAGPSLKQPTGLRSPSEWLVAHYTVPEYIRESYEMQLEIAMENVKLLKQVAGDKIQAVFVSGTDLGTQRAQYISNDMYRDFYLPYHKRINDWIHENTSWKTFFHTCGAIVKLLPELHEAGVDILNPVQCSAAGMDPVMLKKEWGDKFVFWGGGVDTQRILPFGTPEEVYRQVSERLNIFAPGGGFVFSTIHNIMGPTSPENLMAMFQAIGDYNEKNK